MTAFIDRSRSFSIRTVSPQAFSRSEARVCLEPGCRRTTREAKPYCTEHVTEQPYVQEVLALINAAESEVEAVHARGRRAVDSQGLVATEILRQLRVYGAMTAVRLARDLSLDVSVLDAYLRALASQGLISLARGSRKQILVHPASAGSRRRLA